MAPSFVRHDRWIVLTLLVVFVVLVLGSCGLGIAMLFSNMQRFLDREHQMAVPINQSIQLSINDSQITSRLGKPIALHSMFGRLVHGPLNPKGESYEFCIRGPKGEGLVEGTAKATPSGGPYQISLLTVTFADKSKATIVGPAAD